MPRHGDESPSRIRGGLLAIAGALVVAGALAWLVWQLFAPTPGEQPQMRVGLVAVPAQEPLAIASVRGALDPRRVLVVEQFSLQDLHNAFLDGNIHAGIVSLDEALRLTAPPVSARIESFVGASHAPMWLMSGSGIANVAALRGRRIGLEAGRRAMGALRELLWRDRLTLGDVRLRLLDAESASEVLEQGQVDAVLLYAPFSIRFAHAGGRTLARWDPPAEGELMVLVANARAHRLDAGQIEHIGEAWRIGARVLLASDSAATALVARREGISSAEVAEALASEHFLGFADDRRLHGPVGRPVVDAVLATIAQRWRSLGVPDTLPPLERWLLAPGRGS